MLTEGEQEMLSGLLYRGLSRREFSSTGDFIRELDVMLDVLRCGGVHPAILRASAERFSKTFSSRPARNGPTIYYDDVIIE